MARPRVVTDEVLERICAHLERARPLTTACRLENMKPDTVKELMERDEKVREAIEMARAKGEEALLTQLTECVKGAKSPHGVTWWLEKLYPTRWGRAAVQRIEKSGPGGKPQEIKHSLDAEQLRGLLRIARTKKD